MEFNDIYDKDRRLTGRIHKRGTPWKKDEFGLVVCVWVYNDQGQLLLTRRAPEKTFAGTWENSGGAAQAGETSQEAIARELYEETGIQAAKEEFKLIETGRYRNCYYDFYCIRRNTPIEEIVLLPGETDDVKWATYEEIHQMIAEKQICKVIAKQFIRQEQILRDIQSAQEKA